MSKKFHVAMFCSDAAYAERRAFYTGIFGVPYDGPINEGSEGHSYQGSIWDTKDGLCFGLLIKPDLTGFSEQLAHVGFIFDTGVEFDAEIQRRGIDMRKINKLQAGQRQVFIPDERVPDVQWEFSCSEING
jgi:catechol 2,3-dioxygenase-like lactoylglutathione lyase family enzyme